MTEMCRQVVSHAMDIHAGHMIQAGPRNFLANIYAAVPISITVEGANILTRNLIIFGQGAIRCHPYLLKEVELIGAPNTNIAELDKVLMSHMGFYISNLLRNIAYGLTGGRLIFVRGKNRRIKKYTRQLTRMSAALALLADTSLILLGGSLKRRERISARLGDIMSQLYLASTVLKYYHDNNQPSTDVDYVCWSVQCCLQKIQMACDELLSNFPHPFLAAFLGLIIFPFGTAYRQPRDKLTHKIVSGMLAPSELRDRLTRYCYVSDRDDELSCRLDKALQLLPAVEPLQKLLSKAVQSKKIPGWYNYAERVQAAQEAGILSPEDAQKLNDYEALKAEIIKVNEFSFDLSKVIA
jgi:acyl-CoA dehydrogenase